MMDSIHILLVEDNEGDIILTTEALEESEIANTMSVVKDGRHAIDFLNKTEPYQKETLPDLILLDINLPKKNGHEVLRYIRNSETLKEIAVIMLTTSSSERDIRECEKQQSNGYMIKPLDVKEFMTIVAGINTLPGNSLNMPKTT